MSHNAILKLNWYAKKMSKSTDAVPQQCFLDDS